MPLDKSKIKNILVISLTNIGDVILTFPVVDILKNDFPQAKVSIITGPKAHSLVKDNANFQDVFIFDKQNTSFHTLPWLWMLRRKNYDLVVDLRNSAIPILIGAKRRVSLFAPKPVSAHMKEKHLKRLALIHPFTRESQRKYSGEVSGVDQKYVDDLINSSVGENKPFIVVAPGSAFHKKQWSQTAYAKVCDELVSKYNVKVVFVGDESDSAVSEQIMALMKIQAQAVNLCGRTTLIQLAHVLEKSMMAIVNDSAPMHLASYLDKPVVGLFGPSDPAKYGPWGANGYFLKAGEEIDAITSEQVLQLIEDKKIIRDESYFSENKPSFGFAHKKIGSAPDYKNILIVRTDRIGDVILTTPSIKALKKAYPKSKISVLVAPGTKTLIEGHRDVYEIMEDDRTRGHKGLFGFLKLVLQLRKRRFDCAIVYHTKKRTNTLCFLAGIPIRIGYKNNKFGFLLNRPLKDERHLGQKHEAQYCLDVLKSLAVESDKLDLFVAHTPENDKWVDNILTKNDITSKDKLIAVHPGASDPAKQWPAAQFGELIDGLINQYACKVVILGAPNIMAVSKEVTAAAGHRVLDLTGRTTLGQLVSLLRRADMLVSNDSGPVHIAAALQTPVVSIFTRDAPGINPQRWQPLGTKSKFVSPPNLSTRALREAVDALFKLC